MITLKTPLNELPGVGTTTTRLLKKLKIETCKDLIFYFPHRFDDFSSVIPITQVVSGMSATICARIEFVANRRLRTKRKTITEMVVSDESGTMKIVWFNQPYLLDAFPVGEWMLFAGKISSSFFDAQLVNPVFEKITEGKDTLHVARLVPVYSLTSRLSQKQLRGLIKRVLDFCVPLVQEWLPVPICKEEKLYSFSRAINAIHFPKNADDLMYARKRLEFDELFFFQICALFLRKDIRERRAYPIACRQDEIQNFIALLPFALTPSQNATLLEMMRDMSKAHPMSRLIHGDVGSGKTVLAALATLTTVRSGFQTLLLAPTEILAQQHWETFVSFFQKSSFTLALRTSSFYLSWSQESGIRNYVSKQERKILADAIANGSVDSIIGTHALVQDSMTYARVGLAIIDEQHRFGVLQRKTLREKNCEQITPHLLSLSATPIPRTLCLTLYSDLDISVLQDAPSGRKKIITKIVPREYREWTIDFIRKEHKKGRQIFVLCPLIDPSDNGGAKSVKEEANRLQKTVFPDMKIGVLHGKMKAVAKEKVMQEMKEGRIDLLVTTSVIEVGIHIPNVSIMIVEGAERFGLAQLHQLRGRVGRSTHQSYCFLFPTEYDHDLSERLEFFASCIDGFALAEKDLELRGVGDMYGTRQSGMPNLKFADFKDRELIQKTRLWAQRVLDRFEKYPALKKRVEEYVKGMHGE